MPQREATGIAAVCGATAQVLLRAPPAARNDDDGDERRATERSQQIAHDISDKEDRCSRALHRPSCLLAEPERRESQCDMFSELRPAASLRRAFSFSFLLSFSLITRYSSARGISVRVVRRRVPKGRIRSYYFAQVPLRI